MSGVKVFKSKPFTTPTFRAVFPDLNKPDRFDSYKVDCDVTENPEIEATIRAQIDELRPKACADFGLAPDTQPDNDPVRVGESKDGQPFRRLSFKMKSVKRVKGKEVAVRPRLVDAHRNNMTELIFGGSVVKVAYYIQATLVNNQFYVSVKLNAVQVIEHVGPGGEAAISDLFADEDGFTTDVGDEATSAPAAPVNNSDEAQAAVAGDF